MRVLRRTVPLLTLVAIAAAVPALAQTPVGAPLKYNQTCNEATKDTQRAVQLFNVGQQFLTESNFDKAIGLFKDAYDTDCTAVDLLRWLADAFERAGNRPEEVRALKEYLRRTPNPPDKSTLEKRIINLGGSLDSAPTATTSAPTAVATVPTASATTTATTAPTTTASATATTAPTTAPTSAPGSTGRGHTVYPWIVVGAGGAAVITGGILLAIGSGKVSTADSACNPMPPGSRMCSNSDAVTSGNSGRSLETVGVIVGAVGLAAVAGGLVWHFMEPTRPKQEAGPSAHVTPAVGPGYAGLSLGGAF